jgi:hypothetical protein
VYGSEAGSACFIMVGDNMTYDAELEPNPTRKHIFKAAIDDT